AYAQQYYESADLAELKVVAISNSKTADIARLVLWDRKFKHEASQIRAAVDNRFEDQLEHEKESLRASSNALSFLNILQRSADPRETRRKELMQGAVDVLSSHAKTT